MPANSLLARRSLTKINLLASAAAAVLLSACSTDFERFANNPSDADPVYTASVPKKKAAAPSDEDEIASKPLAGASQAPTYSYDNTAKAPVYKQQNTVTSAPQVAEAEAPTAPEGGTVTVGSGMTLYAIARANNVSVQQLAAANNIKPPYAVRQGQVLRMPGSAQAAAPAIEVIEDEAPAPKAAAAAPKAKSGDMHQVAGGETLFSIGRNYGVSPYAIADANGLSKSSTLSIGQKLKIPGASGTVAAAPKASTQPKTAAVPDEETPAETKVAKDEAKIEPIPAPDAEEGVAPEQKVAELPAPAAAEDASTGMRWPVRGKVISTFGSKPNGLKNEGINIAVPEGTSIRAAEGGVVAYSGNELKGYGNLILIRHEGGFVTAYAHAKELFVKRGDTVKRGDVIAKAGQTGSVSSPQLHFEVRKGATALDPMKYLSSATAAN